MSRETIATFLFEMANFVGLAAVLAWLFFKPVRKVLEEQRAKIVSQQDEAARTLAEAEAVRAEIAAERTGLAEELNQMRQKTLQLAKEEAAAVVDDARKHMEHERDALRRDAVNIQRAQTAKTSLVVAAAAERTVSRLLRQLSGPDLQQMLVTAACNELASFTNNSLETLTIESANELSAKERSQIESVLGRAKKKADYRIVPNLGGGLRISTAEGLIDTSIAGIARFAEETLSSELERVLREDSDALD